MQEKTTLKPFVGLFEDSKKCRQSPTDGFITFMRMSLRIKLKTIFVVSLMHYKNRLTRQVLESRQDLQHRHTVSIM